jgi:peptidoglycan/xylan/chitin deacetylase (PgdA/CDA1 family)
MERQVALTFDVEFPDRPNWQVDTLTCVLDTLASEGVPGTFFLQGRWVEACPDQARRIAADGHAVGNHSFSHCNYLWLSPEGIRADVLQAEKAIRDTAACDPRPWFRLPFGSGLRAPHVRSALHELGYQCVHWNVDARDWDSTLSPDDLVTIVAGQVAARPWSTVLLHGWPDSTARGLPGLIRRLRADGVRFSRLGAAGCCRGDGHERSHLHV